MQKTESPEQTLAQAEAQLRSLQSDIGSSEFSWTLADLLLALQGDAELSLEAAACEPEAIHFNSVSTDSRTLAPGALYIALAGERFDGHDFIEQAVVQGAAVILAERSVDAAVPVVVVDNSRLALGRFAAWHRMQMPVQTLVAITGSNGKTTTKTLLNQLFSSVGETLATQGNLNNDLGVPRTLLNLRPRHQYAVIEMGANHPGEIAYLTELAKPDIALLNNASGAHLEGFGSLQGVIETKGEIFDGLNRFHQNGVAIINCESAGFDFWLQKLQQNNACKILKFGLAPSADVRLNSVESDADGVGFTVEYAAEKHAVKMPVLGTHNAYNAAACIAVCHAAGLQWQQMQPVLQSFTGVGGRLQPCRLQFGYLIDDSYNANPESVKAGIRALKDLGGISMLCLGAMGELGVDSEQGHRSVAEFAQQAGIQHLWLLGEETEPMLSVFHADGRRFDDHQQMIAELKAFLRQSNEVNILVKGSRTARMELVTQALTDEFAVEK
ncbi:MULTISPECIES: UDP-N-acetylmuramoyl-tripeptide--D-alanyl-D-alanine ligase [Thiomicrorhabdus]|uniref:UDP-N-acetylmuramoyl-tripeptide--D-alanyl-D-alanine ligase n=1 Tax=Thiomicrorhabdus heinhorstiae TaxID=2748010 RepID=A0ABS0BXP4_9GAMM|nr:MULTISPECIES: UDP-N-acetylmuramoyl-tripeptide--D-alanyl-D-alanine ligase [Thiomicrorhabdus]MBF6058560.1 UDP-N-acetylmuramoyl-tripeptide--D-alanyl-D-alanine ligase [Thiomicrorhabdus heinhorstiae]